jgi:hypothetical protein
MVGDDAQLYTIEGIAASVLILTTVYLVLTTTVVFTPGETHIYDMQLEQLGSDVLAAMDNAPSWNDPNDPYPQSPLEAAIEQNQPVVFSELFLTYCNATTEERRDDLRFSANITYRNETSGQVGSKLFAGSQYNREHAVTVTRWVNIDNTGNTQPGLDLREQSVLLEVLLWRG